MTVVRLPVRGYWAWDARGDNRAVRVSPHPRENVVNLSVWRDELCVGTVRLQPSDAAALVAGLTEGLAELADSPEDGRARPGDQEKLREMELRLARLESRLAPAPWRTAMARAAEALGSWRRQPRR